MQKTNQNDEIEIDLRELFELLLHRIWIIIPAGMLAFVLGFSYATFFITPMFKSTTGIYVMSRQNSDGLTLSDTQLSSQLTKDYEELIQSRTVLESVIEQTGISETYEGLKSRISISNVGGTHIIYITITDPSPDEAMLLANSIREAAAVHIKDVTAVEAVNVVDEANYPTHPSGPPVMKWALICAFAGVVLSSMIIVIRYLFDDTIKYSEDVEKYLGWSTLAIIPLMSGETGKKQRGKEKK